MTDLLRGVNQLGNLLLALAELLLQMAKQFLFLAFGVGQVVVGEIGELLPELPFQLMPLTFELEFVHDQVRKGLESMPEKWSSRIAARADPFACHTIAPLPSVSA
jgi:hypothetical protein